MDRKEAVIIREEAIITIITRTLEEDIAKTTEVEDITEAAGRSEDVRMITEVKIAMHNKKIPASFI